MNTHDQPHQFQLRLHFAKKGDFFALKTEGEIGSGKANEFAEKLSSTKVNRSNVRGLETLAWSTESVADILDYIRVRVGRDNKNREWGKNNIGIDLANYLEGLQKDAAKFCGQLNADNQDNIRQLHLEYCREFIKHLAALHEFHVKEKGLQDESES